MGLNKWQEMMPVFSVCLMSSMNALPFLNTCQCHLINWLACMIIPELIAFTPLLFFFIFYLFFSFGRRSPKIIKT